MRHYTVLFILIMCSNLNNFCYGKPPVVVGKAIMKGGDLLDAGEFQRVIDHLTPIIEQYPDQVKLHRLRGRAYFSIKPADLDNAEYDFNQAVQLDPKDEVAKKLVKKIREARDAQKSAMFFTIINLGLGFLVDILTLIIGFSGGFVLDGLRKKFLWKRKANKLYREKKYYQYTDLLENKLNETAYSEVRSEIENQLDTTKKQTFLEMLRKKFLWKSKANKTAYSEVRPERENQLDAIKKQTFLEMLGKNIINEDHKRLIYKMLLRILQESEDKILKETDLPFIEKHLNPDHA